jgi:integrase
VRRYDGVIYIDINDKGDKRLKTASSRRKIPLHHELLRIGFMDFVAMRKAMGDERLFPELKKSEGDGTYSYAFSKWFNRFLKATGVKSAGKCFHSFRHGFEDACRRADISGDKTDMLQGHKLPGMRAEYGEGYSLKSLAEAVDRLTWPGLELSHLHAKVTRKKEADYASCDHA